MTAPLTVFLIGAALAASGVATVTTIIFSRVTLPGTQAVTSFEQQSSISGRWPPPEEFLPKDDKIALALTEPNLLAPALIGPPDGALIEQAIERQREEKEIEKYAEEYKHLAAKVEHDVCRRHGMHKVYIHHRRHVGWRCRH